jgi:hypothetical protein
MLHEMYDGLLVMEQFNNCIIGVIKDVDNKGKICYSYRKVIAQLIRDDKMTKEDAIEYFYFNIMGLYVGENIPCFLFTEDD